MNNKNLDSFKNEEKINNVNVNNLTEEDLEDVDGGNFSSLTKAMTMITLGTSSLSSLGQGMSVFAAGGDNNNVVVQQAAPEQPNAQDENEEEQAQQQAAPAQPQQNNENNNGENQHNPLLERLNINTDEYLYGISKEKIRDNATLKEENGAWKLTIDWDKLMIAANQTVNGYGDAINYILNGNGFDSSDYHTYGTCAGPLLSEAKKLVNTNEGITNAEQDYLVQLLTSPETNDKICGIDKTAIAKYIPNDVDYDDLKNDTETYDDQWFWDIVVKAANETIPGFGDKLNGILYAHIQAQSGIGELVGGLLSGKTERSGYQLNLNQNGGLKGYVENYVKGWSYDGNGTLTISNDNAMRRYLIYIGGRDDRPWAKVRNKIKTVIIGNEVTKISESAFYGFENLESITIPARVETIGKVAFENCKNLTKVNFEGESRLKVIDGYAFCNCEELKSITIPESVESIRRGAFNSCDSLTEVNFKNGSKLYTIGEYAFCNCEELKSITIPESVEYIEYNAFERCDNLTEVKLKKIPEFDEYFFKIYKGLNKDIFKECEKLEKIVVPNGTNMNDLPESLKQYANLMYLESGEKLVK